MMGASTGPDLTRRDEVYDALQSLSNPDWRKRQQAAQALARIAEGKDYVAVPPLLGSLRDADNGVRAASIRALGRIGTRLDDSDEAQSLRKRIVQGLIRRLSDQYVFARQAAAEVLGQLADPRAVRPLNTTLHDKDARVAYAAADSLGLIGDQRAMHLLIKGIYSQEPHIQRAATRVLGQVGDVTVVLSLTRCLKTRQVNIRLAAIEALESICVRSSDTARWIVPALLDTVNEDISLSVQIDATRALGRIGQQLEMGSLLVKVLDNLLEMLAVRADITMRAEAAHALGQIGRQHRRAAEQARVDLIDALRSPESSVRAAAVYALGQFNDPTLVSLLVARLNDEDVIPSTEFTESRLNRRVCDAAAEALEQIGTPEALEAVRVWREKDGGDSTAQEST
jgi:HEAT repeat protein